MAARSLMLCCLVVVGCLQAGCWCFETLQLVNWPRMSACGFAGRPCRPSEIVCPLAICNRHTDLVVVSHRIPQLFMLCTTERRFCGFCAPGYVFDASNILCRSAFDPSNLHINQLPVDMPAIAVQDCSVNAYCSRYNNTLDIVWYSMGATSFMLCSPSVSFCGFCPSNTPFHLKHQTCIQQQQQQQHADDQPTADQQWSEAGTVAVFKLFTVRDIERTMARRMCCQDCLTERNLSLISYLRLCRF